MVEVEVLNERKEKTKHCVLSNALEENEYKLTCLVWIINEFDELLINQRRGNIKNSSNKWGTISGIVTVDDDISSNTVLRIIKDKYNIKTKKESLIYIGCYKRSHDFVDVWLIKISKDSKIVPKRNIVQSIEWVKILKYENMIRRGLAISNGYGILKKYYNDFYNK